MPHLPHQRDRLQPAEALFDAFTFPLTDPVTVMPRRPTVNRAATFALQVLGYMRRHLHLPALGHEVPGVIAFVGSHRDVACAGDLFQHHQTRIPLRRAVGLKQFRVYDQPVAVLRQEIAVVTELGFLAVAFPCQ